MLLCLLDLTTAWTNASVPIVAISKDSATALNDKILWTTPDGKQAYLWGGDLSALTIYSGEQAPPAELWRFSTDGTGSGSWSQVAPESTFSVPVRQESGSSTSIKDAGYYIGGDSSQNSDPSLEGKPVVPQSGLTSFNFTSGSWGK